MKGNYWAYKNSELKYTIYEPFNVGEDVCIGDGTKIGSYCELQNGVIIGKNCSIHAYVYIPSNVIIMDDVFIGARVTFTNDKYPPSDNWKDCPPTIVNNSVAIGAGSIILPNLIIGNNATIGAGSLVTKNIPPNQMWYGSPARFIKRILNENFSCDTGI